MSKSTDALRKNMCFLDGELLFPDRMPALPIPSRRKNQER